MESMVILEYIYKIFYTVVSMSIIGTLLVPIVILIRIIIPKAPRRYMVWLWFLLYMRIICPIALSSVLCIKTEWNRNFHILLNELGLSMPDVAGIMTGWFTVFINDIKTSRNYKICAIAWLIGVIVIWLVIFIRQCQLKRILKNAVKIYDRIYQVEGLGIPLIEGIFIVKVYLPAEMKAADTKYILNHMEMHKKRLDGFWRFLGLFTVSIHWFNLLIWAAYYLFNVDIEFATDEAVVKKIGKANVNEYAQNIVNMYKGRDKLPNSFYTFKERYIKKRAAVLINYKGVSKTSAQVFILIWLLLFIWWFMLRPLQLLWLESVAGERLGSQGKDIELFEEKESSVVAKIITTSANGLNRIIKIVMKDGKFESGKGYDGLFDVVIQDTFGIKLSSFNLNDIFSADVGEKLHFDEGMVIYANDYNGNGKQEIVLGQDIGSSDESFLKATGEIENKQKLSVQEYYIWEVEETSLKCIAGPIYTTDSASQSKKFDMVNRTEGIFGAEINGISTYYKWNNKKGTYIQKAFKSKQIEQYREQQNDDDRGTLNNSYVLKTKSGDRAVKVLTRKDDTGSEIIKEIILNPDNTKKKFEGINGYYCDITWATISDLTQRYAVLTYNGTKSQTFKIYDTKENKIYYENEDGNKMLAALFKKYTGDYIKFKSDNIVVYSLQEINEDVLTINFAADTADDITVKGSYKYNIFSGRCNNFSYAQTTK